MSLIQQITAASTGALLTTFIVTPFDVIKTQIQVNKFLIHNMHNVQKNSLNTAFGSMRYILQQGGIRGFWRGLSPSLIMQVPGTGIYYATYENLKNELNRSNIFTPEYSPLFAGSLSRVIAGTVTSPFEFIRTMYQANLSSNKLSQSSFLSLLRMMVNGQVNPWTGLGITLLRDVPFSSIYWFGYEKLRTRFMKRSEPEYMLTYSFLSGAISGITAAVLTNPLDVIKSKIQGNGLEIAADSAQQRKILFTAKSLYREDGLRAFMRGCLPRAFKIAPACGIMISTYELFKPIFFRFNNSRK